MNNLSKKIKIAFLNKEEKYKIKKIIVSGSDEVGEGEQKIFKYIRNNKDHINKNICVYGLDSDLIMLSIFHCDQCSNIFVFREEPEFIKSKVIPTKVEKIKKTNETLSIPELETLPRLKILFLDIHRLSESILNEMTPNTINSSGVKDIRVCRRSGVDEGYTTETLNSKVKNARVYDYLFLCFFLGNDFLPHFPSLNIRTNGIQILIETYKSTIGKYEDRYFISKNGKIQWKWLKKFVENISKLEKQMFLNEYSLRDKMDYYKWQQTTKEEKENVLNNAPVIYRAEEKYICPTEKMWEERYYKILFVGEERTEECRRSGVDEGDATETLNSGVKDERENIKMISNNFLEGLEWVFKYYTDDCPDWKWKYRFHYPPLFVDLLKYIPEIEKDFIIPNMYSKIPFSPQLQLSYVLPEVNHYLLGEKNKDYLKKNYSCLFPDEIIYKWAFCRYFYESHILLPDININILEKLNNELVIMSVT